MKHETFPEELARLLKAGSRTKFALAKVNFEVGRIVYETLEKGGEGAVKELAASHPRNSVWFERFLFDACRVFRSIKRPGFLYAMKTKLEKHGGDLSWGFLLEHCTKAPQGDTEEANLYWDGKLSQLEGAFGDLEEANLYRQRKMAQIHQALKQLGRVINDLPPQIREHVEGFLAATSEAIEPMASRQRDILSGPVTFGHIGDIQMCETFTTAGRLVIDAATGKNERLLDLQRCLDYAVDTMLERDCRVILVPGDVCETEKPTPNEQGCLRVAFEKAAAHCPVIVCPGNHDLSDNPKDASALEFLKGRRNIYVVEKPSVLYLEGTEVNHEPSAMWPQQDCMKIFIVPFPSRGSMNGEANGKSIAELNELASTKLRLLIENFRVQIDPRVPNVLLLHLTVAGAEGATNEVMLRFDPNVSIMDLRGFDYVACDHIHKFQRIGASFSVEGLLAGDNGSGHKPEEFPVAYYSGSIDRMDFNEENDPKGFIVGTFNGRKPSVEFVETPARRFVTLPVEFFSAEDWKNLLDPRTIYRVKGEVTKEGYEALKPKLREFPLPLLNKLTVRREVKVRDAGMTDDLKEGDALRRYLSTQATETVDEATLTLCLQEHEKLAVE